MKLLVAALLLGALALGTREVVARLAPEAQASASGVSEKVPAPISDTVRSVRVTGATGRFELQTREGAALDPRALDDDRLRIVRVLAADGYLDAGVAMPRVHHLDDGISVELPVITGARYLVREVRLEGRQLTRHPDLSAVPTLRPDQEALAARIDGNIDLLRDWLAHRGVTASVGARLDIDRYAQAVDVIFTVD